MTSASRHLPTPGSLLLPGYGFRLQHHGHGHGRLPTPKRILHYCIIGAIGFGLGLDTGWESTQIRSISYVATSMNGYLQTESVARCLASALTGGGSCSSMPWRATIRNECRSSGGQFDSFVEISMSHTTIKTLLKSLLRFQQSYRVGLVV